MRENLPIAGRVQANVFERVDDPLYPPVALREALANAFCHRDYRVGGGSVAAAVYDDRLEITSTGTLHFGLTPDMLYRPHESLTWNPLIARVFYRCGVIEAWGRGTIKMEELTSRAGLPSPKIYENAGCVVVQFCPMVAPTPRQGNQQVTERQKQILLILGAHREGMAFRQIQTELAGDIPAWEIKNELSGLKKIGLAKSHGRGRGARWFVA